MFHLMYFRSHHCESSIDWSVFDVENVTVEPQMPIETSLVTRTFYIAIIQVVLNFLLVVTSIVMLSNVLSIFVQKLVNLFAFQTVSTKAYWLCSTRRYSYWIFFMPLCVVFLATIFIDVITATFYSFDLFRSYVSKLLLRTLWTGV